MRFSVKYIIFTQNDGDFFLEIIWKMLFAHTSARKRSLSRRRNFNFQNEDCRAKTAKNMEFYGGFGEDTKMDVLRAKTQF